MKNLTYDESATLPPGNDVIDEDLYAGPVLELDGPMWKAPCKGYFGRFLPCDEEGAPLPEQMEHYRHLECGGCESWDIEVRDMQSSARIYRLILRIEAQAYSGFVDLEELQERCLDIRRRLRVLHPDCIHQP